MCWSLVLVNTALFIHVEVVLTLERIISLSEMRIWNYIN